MTIRLGEAFEPPPNMGELIKTNSTSIYSMFRLEVNDKLNNSKNVQLNKEMEWQLAQVESKTRRVLTKRRVLNETLTSEVKTQEHFLAFKIDFSKPWQVEENVL